MVRFGQFLVLLQQGVKAGPEFRPTHFRMEEAMLADDLDHPGGVLGQLGAAAQIPQQHLPPERGCGRQLAIEAVVER